MLHEQVTFCFLFCIYACTLVRALPADFLTVDLSVCDNLSKPSCVASCEVVVKAQEHCIAGDGTCVCAVAPPLAVQDCLKCQTALQGDDYTWRGLQLVPTRLTAYAEACNTMKARSGLTVLAAARHETKRDVPPPSSAYNCLYGLPSVGHSFVAQVE